MGAKLISGTELSATILNELHIEVEKLKQKYNKVPGLVTIIVGKKPASVSYVTLKMKNAERLGFHGILEELAEDVSQEFLLEKIAKYNADSSIHGILVQLPLPKHICEEKVIYAISPEKDVDGFHPVNLGRLLLGDRNNGFLPCTPAGIQEMLIRSNVTTMGANIVIVGRSNIVGKPLMNMLVQKGLGGEATVTLAHSKTKDLRGICKQADILIAAVGVASLIKEDWIKPGAVVIDVGVNRVGTNSETGKTILCGDVDFENVKNIASLITPVPGGVGPMTVAMLMKNTVRSARLFYEKNS